MGHTATWRKFPISRAELCIDTTLRCGQSFRWRKFDDIWRCSLYGRIVSLRQDEDWVHFKAMYPPSPSPVKKHRPRGSEADDTEALLRSYFNLHLDLRALYDQWSRDDANFRAKALKFSGIRILNQDAWEALVCFICSSNNNITRISQMAHKLCLHYGSLLGTVDRVPYHDFPPAIALAAPGVERHLRQLGFGYRAKYIVQTAQAICSKKPPGWLMQLRNADSPRWPGADTVLGNADVAADDCDGEATPITYKTAREQLLLLSGVGPKVADCVCLMGLGWGEAVPVDTHVWQIAVRDYKFKKTASKTFSKALYDSVGDHFRSLWGDYAGWAQSVLFTANLKTFSDRLETEGAASVVRNATGRVLIEGKRKAAEEAEDDGKVAAEAANTGKRRRR